MIKTSTLARASRSFNSVRSGLVPFSTSLSSPVQRHYHLEFKPSMATVTSKTGQTVDRAMFESLLKRRMFYTPSFEIYGGYAGLFDYGPPGCALQANVVDLWRKHFVLQEDMLEVDCPAVTPAEVLKTSGHVDKFADWMCKDPKTGEIFRADHLVEEALEARLKGDKEARGQKVAETEEEKKAAAKKKKKAQAKAVKLDDAVVQEYETILAQIDNYDGSALGELITKHGITNPTTGGPVNAPIPFNLMFETNIGPSGALKGYLRPETAQGQFANFAKLLDFNQQSMPFASASVGKSFRNEISPRAGLLRVREFLMAEIEHYVDPAGGKRHARFPEVADAVQLDFLDRATQLAGRTAPTRMSIGAAVSKKLVDNETLGYFLARIHLFLRKLGIDEKRVRFRQHLANEMAHYATDCWDAELRTSYGWIECVGCADRSAYDLTVHARRTGAPLSVRQRRDEPLRVEEWQVDIDQKEFGLRFRKDAKAVKAAVEGLSQELRETMALELKEKGKMEVEVEGVDGGKAELGSDLVQIEWRTRVENVREYTPNVIEPSFGIGRILYSLMEHVYWYREGAEERAVSHSPFPPTSPCSTKFENTAELTKASQVLSFPPLIAPNKVLIVPLSNQPDFRPLITRLTTTLRAMNISHRVDDSSTSIGRRYARNDELGTPLGVTVDFQSVKDNTFTLRDRDSTRQVRADEGRICEAIRELVEGRKGWKDVQEELPEFKGQELE